MTSPIEKDTTQGFIQPLWKRPSGLAFHKPCLISLLVKEMCMTRMRRNTKHNNAPGHVFSTHTRLWKTAEENDHSKNVKTIIHTGKRSYKYKEYIKAFKCSQLDGHQRIHTRKKISKYRVHRKYFKIKLSY